MTALGTPARHLGTVGSTMDEAARWATEGAPHGAVVVAEHQDGGRGRHGRTWADAPGQSLLFTVVLRVTVGREAGLVSEPGGKEGRKGMDGVPLHSRDILLGPDRIGLIPLAAGLAVAEVAASFGADARIKWPNDVRVEQRKLAGVLAETTWAGDRARVLLGVGLNVSQDAFPPPLADTATSLRLATGQPVARLAPLRPILDRLAALLHTAETDPAALVAAVEARLEGVGETVTVRDPSNGRTVASGTVLGLAPTGALRLATDAGETAVVAGEVTLAAP